MSAESSSSSSRLHLRRRHLRLQSESSLFPTEPTLFALTGASSTSVRVRETRNDFVNELLSFNASSLFGVEKLIASGYSATEQWTWLIPSSIRLVDFVFRLHVSAGSTVPLSRMYMRTGSVVTSDFTYLPSIHAASLASSFLFNFFHESSRAIFYLFFI